MSDKNDIKKYTTILPAGGKLTLAESKTKLYILAENILEIVKVDEGIIRDGKISSRKCDYLVFDRANRQTHLVELKGQETIQAAKQLQQTLIYLENRKDCEFFVENCQVVDAYVVSPGRQKIPKGKDSKERELARKLASKSKRKFKDILRLIAHVKVVDKKEEISYDAKSRTIISSAKAPVTFNRELIDGGNSI